MSYLGGFDVETRVYFQDRAIVSKRIGATVSGIVTAVMLGLTDPTVQAALPAVISAYVPPLWVPLVTTTISAGLAGWSKAVDPRPVDRS